jgi:hypothetical protein
LEHLELLEHLRWGGPLELLEGLELVERSDALRSWRDFENHSLHERRRVSQCKNLPAQFVIGDLPGDAGEFFALEGYFHLRVLDHVLAPVLALYFARGRIIVAVVVNQAQLYGSRLTGFSSDRCQIGDQSRSIVEIHCQKYKRLPVTAQVQLVPA